MAHRCLFIDYAGTQCAVIVSHNGGTHAEWHRLRDDRYLPALAAMRHLAHEEA